MSRIIHKYYNLDTSPENKSLILNSEWGNHKRLGFLVYYCPEDEISSSGHDGKGTVRGYFYFRAGIIF